ncbi:MAG: hypothetical protein IT159_02635 [Bryobacterales bacterium]|nr:hypothetical protein [Bryobacterales bacterium]
MKLRWEFRLSLLSLLALLASGCGNSGRSAAPQSGPSVAASPAVKVSKDNPCSVLSPAEVGEILGLPSEMREIVDEATCHYHFKPAGGGRPEAASEETYIEVKIHWTGGRTAVLATRLAGKLLGGGSGGFEKLAGIGDEAWAAPYGAYLAFSKGDVGVEIDMRMLPGEKDKAIRLAKLIASRV